MQFKSNQLQWIKTIVTVGDQQLLVCHQNALEIVSFFISHGPFQRDMIFLPVKQYLSAGTRIYNELNTVDWWWEIQEQLLLSVTIVLIILASDKTQLI